MARILFVCHVYPRTPGGAEASFMHDLARLAARGHDVTVLAPHDAGLPMQEVWDGVSIRRFRYAADDKETLAYRGNMHDQVFKDPRRAFLFARFLRRWRQAIRVAIADIRPDLVHVHWWVPGGLVARKVCVQARVPYVMTCHGTDVFLLRKLAIARRLAKPVFRDAAAVHTVSSALRDVVEQATGRRADAVFTMPADLPAFEGHPEPVPGRVVYVGRLVRVKGVKHLVDAVRILAEDGIDVHLEIIGDGPLRAELVAQAAGLPITFRGTISRPEVARALSRSSMFVLPSTTTPRGEAEGLGVVLLEAMAAGVPVIGTRNGGIVDVIDDGSNGLLVPEGDPAAIADAIHAIMADPDAARRRATAAKAGLAARFGPDAIAAALDDLYERGLA